jgi:hypothetical protein
VSRAEGRNGKGRSSNGKGVEEIERIIIKKYRNEGK